MAGYGSVDSDASTLGGSAAGEETPLLPLSVAKAKDWIRHELGGRDMVVSNLVLSLATAMLDVVCYTKYQTFGSNQTGNTVMLATATLHMRTNPRHCILASTSLVAWLSGAFIFGQWRRRGRATRGWLFLTSTVQILLLLSYVYLISPYAPTSFDLDGRYEWMPMGLCAFQSGIQFVMCTGVNVNEINAATVTASYASLVADPLLFSTRRQTGRDRRFVYLVIFWVGCALGLQFQQRFGGWVAGLVVTAVKLVSFVIIYFAEEVEQPGERH